MDPATGQDVPTGQACALWVRGYVVMKGCYRDPEATARALGSSMAARAGRLLSC